MNNDKIYASHHNTRYRLDLICTCNISVPVHVNHIDNVCCLVGYVGSFVGRSVKVS